MKYPYSITSIELVINVLYWSIIQKSTETCIPAMADIINIVPICSPGGGRFTKHFVSDFRRQMLKATEILASDWLGANLSVEITDLVWDDADCALRP